MQSELYPILEFDPTREAVIEPRLTKKPLEALPTAAVLCFFQDVISRLVQIGTATRIHSIHTEIGTHPIYEVASEFGRITVCQPGVGAPLAAGFMEELIALGCDRFVACGGAGVLNSEIAVGHVVIPSAAIRDEGTSYHYLPPAREVAADPAIIGILEGVLQSHKIDYLVGKTWTTDAYYRETPAKVARRKQEGCLVVEMETATFLAVSQFRGVRFGQYLYGGDDLGGEQWDGRSWNTHSSREKLFWLAAEAVQQL